MSTHWKNVNTNMKVSPSMVNRGVKFSRGQFPLERTQCHKYPSSGVNPTQDYPHHMFDIYTKQRGVNLATTLSLSSVLSRSYDRLNTSDANTNSCFYRKKKKVLRRFGYKNNGTQSVFRESSAQTDPWEPDYVAKGDPELLKLDFLKWGAGLPCGTAELEMIDHIRLMGQWEGRMNISHDFSGWCDMTLQLMQGEFACRDKRISEIQELRMELLENMLSELLEKSECRNERKLRCFYDLKLEEKEKKLATLQRASLKESRRLDANFKGTTLKYRNLSAVELHGNYSSELYIPIIRHGLNPKFGTYLITKLKHESHFIQAPKYQTLPTNLKNYMNIGEVKIEGRLCSRYTKWNEPVLKKLYKELILLSKPKKSVLPKLRIRLEDIILPPLTPEASFKLDDRTELHCILLQKVLKGRCVQCTVAKGRMMLQELIKELKRSTGLMKSQHKSVARDKKINKATFNKHRQEYTRTKMIENLLHQLSGKIVGTLLDFLNKELRRLVQDKWIRALMLKVELLRASLEGKEAGHRQQERYRRKEHDEIFKQTTKINQETVDLYLDGIITEGIEFSSDHEAKSYVHNLLEIVNEDMKEEREFERAGSLREKPVEPLIDNRDYKQILRLTESGEIVFRKERIYDIFENFDELKPNVKEEKPKGTIKKKSIQLNENIDEQSVVDYVFKKIHVFLKDNITTYKNVHKNGILSETIRKIEDLLDSRLREEFKRVKVSINEDAAKLTPILSEGSIEGELPERNDEPPARIHQINPVLNQIIETSRAERPVTLKSAILNPVMPKREEDEKMKQDMKQIMDQRKQLMIDSGKSYHRQTQRPRQKTMFEQTYDRLLKQIVDLVLAEKPIDSRSQFESYSKQARKARASDVERFSCSSFHFLSHMLPSSNTSHDSRKKKTQDLADEETDVAIARNIMETGRQVAVSEHIASLYHQFVIPTINKEQCRARNKGTNKNLLLIAHNEIHEAANQSPAVQVLLFDSCKPETSTSLVVDIDNIVDNDTYDMNLDFLSDIIDKVVKKQTLSKLKPCKIPAHIIVAKDSARGLLQLSSLRQLRSDIQYAHLQNASSVSVRNFGNRKTVKASKTDENLVLADDGSTESDNIN